MQTWSIILMVLFGIGIVVFLYLTMKNTSRNQARQTSNLLIPFSGYLSPPNGVWQTSPNSNNIGTDPNPENGLFLVGMAGGQSNNVPQLTCPVGTKINIVGAFVEVNDQFQTCQATSDPTFQLSCGNVRNLSSAQLCSADTDCPPGMRCFGGKCVPRSCSTSSQCASANIQACPDNLFKSSDGDPLTPEHRNTKFPQLVSIGGTYTTDLSGQITSQGGTYFFDPAYGQCAFCDTSQPNVDGGYGTCANIPLCQGIVNGKVDPMTYTNGVCNNGRCKIRDASSYLAGHCNGKETCLGNALDKWKPNDPQNNPFGPLPCNISVKADDSNDYHNLPIIPGWNQATPLAGSSALNKSSFSQGYYVHGIYTCVPDDEIPNPSS